MSTANSGLPPTSSVPPTPLWWRLGIGLAVLLLLGFAYLTRDSIGLRGQSAFGVICFFGVVAMFSANLRLVSWRTIGWGLTIQFLLALFILKFKIQFDFYGPRELSGYAFFDAIAAVFQQFVAFTREGTKLVFGVLSNEKKMGEVFGRENAFVFAINGLSVIIFVSSFFSVLYYLGVLQVIVRTLAVGMRYLMGTSGAETLSAAANVFMGQTEAPLIIKPYVPKMTQSELMAVMVGGFATIAGSVMAVYMSIGADPVSMLATSVMAAPCGLYLSKLLLPETAKPITAGHEASEVPADEEQPANVIDAAARGASDGMKLALNVAAMLIAFLATIALIDFLLGSVGGGLRSAFPGLGVPEKLTLGKIFSWLFAPVAFLMGVEWNDVPRVADLLGTKLALNEFVAFLQLTELYPAGGEPQISRRSYLLACYALTGFANFGSIGIQLGGIGAMAPNRRGDLARLSGKALLAGFTATLINASIAGMLIPD